jgi:hypothetical protein
MQNGATETEALALREIRLYGAVFAEETDATEGVAAGIRYVETDSRRGFAGIGQQAFTAGFVDGRMITICNDHTKPLAAGCECR